MRSVFFISDQTGITTEKLGNALLAKFPDMQFRREGFPFVDTAAKMSQVLLKVYNRYLQDNEKPIVVSSVINHELHKLLDVEYIILLDFFEAFIPRLEAELGIQASQKINKLHGIIDEEKYNHRIEAIHFSLENDDGVSSKNYGDADVIIVGVSRVGKTPTSIYLAVNYGIKAANYPFAEMDLKTEHLPKSLVPFHYKLFGLSIEPDRLHNVRTHRLPNSKYAQLSTCIEEINAAEKIMNHCGIPYLNTSHKSIEEISVAIMQMVKLKPQY